MDDHRNELCKRINHRIDARGYCVVYDHELAHIWPPGAAFREKQILLIERFAAEHGLAVTIRDTGLNATFKKKREQGEQERTDVKNADTSKTRSEIVSEALAG